MGRTLSKKRKADAVDDVRGVVEQRDSTREFGTNVQVLRQWVNMWSHDVKGGKVRVEKAYSSLDEYGVHVLSVVRNVEFVDKDGMVIGNTWKVAKEYMAMLRRVREAKEEAEYREMERQEAQEEEREELEHMYPPRPYEEDVPRHKHTAGRVGRKWK